MCAVTQIALISLLQVQQELRGPNIPQSLLSSVLFQFTNGSIEYNMSLSNSLAHV